MGRNKKYATEEERKAARREYQKQWREEHPDYDKRRYEVNKDAILEQKKQYYEANKDAIAEQHKQYYEANRAARLEWQKQYYSTPIGEERKAARREYQKQYREANREKIAEQKKQWREEHPDYDKRRYEENKEKIAEQHKQYYEANRAARLEWQKQYYKQYYETPFGRANRLIGSYRQADKKQNRGECTLTAKWVIDNIFNSKCRYCGKTDWTELGCDRIDNDLPHTPDNVVPCCEECNKKRGRKTFEEFLNEAQDNTIHIGI